MTTSQVSSITVLLFPADLRTSRPSLALVSHALQQSTFQRCCDLTFLAKYTLLSQIAYVQILPVCLDLRVFLSIKWG